MRQEVCAGNPPTLNVLSNPPPHLQLRVAHALCPFRQRIAALTAREAPSCAPKQNSNMTVL